jgi:hypothetical protein
VSGRQQEEGPRCEISSTRGPDDEPVCLLTFGPHQEYPSTEDVRRTALELIIAAADAEACLLLSALGLPANVITGFTEDLLRKRGQKIYGSRNTVLLAPAASTKKRRAYVVLRKGETEGLLLASEARSMARQWFEAAEATESDQIVGEALRSCTEISEDAVAAVYKYMAALRGGM